MPSVTYIAVFFAGLLVSMAVTPCIIRLVGRGFGVDKPDRVRKSHAAPTSRLGGLPLFLTFVGVSAWLSFTDEAFFPKWWPVLAGSSLIFVLGFIDDLKPLGAKVKLLGQIGIALFSFGFGIGISMLTNPLTGESVELSVPVTFILTVFWLIALPNIINLIDGMDGLASGLGLFLCLSLAAASIVYSQFSAGLLALGVGGAIFGFLFFNFPPAKIFLGDGGAYFVGFFLAATSLESSQKGSIIAVLFVVMIALGIPIIDTLFAITRRAIKGLPLFRADADHIHHRLLLLGFSKSNALLMLYGVAGVLSLIGLSFYWQKGLALPIAGAFLFLLVLLGARYLGYVETWRGFRTQLRRALRNRREVQFATLLGDVIEMEVDRCKSADEFWSLFDNALSRLHLSRSAAPIEAAGDEAIPVNVVIPHSPTWTLYREASFPKSKNWKVLASLMQPAYARAVERWGDAAATSRHPRPQTARLSSAPSSSA